MKEQDLTEKKVNSTQIYKGKILNLYVDEVILPDGKKSKRECVRHAGGAAVLFVRDGKIALVNQYRYLYAKTLYEIPAGKIDVGEEPACAAARELYEEAGYCANLKHLLDVYPTPGYTDEVIYIYLAEEGEFVGSHLDEGEFLNCDFYPIETVLNMIACGEICDAKTVSAVYKYLYELKR